VRVTQSVETQCDMVEERAGSCQFEIFGPEDGRIVARGVS
jgi:hypothetical protein